MDTHSVSLCNNKDMTNSFCELTNYTELDISVGANHARINIQVDKGDALWATTQKAINEK